MLMKAKVHLWKVNIIKGTHLLSQKVATIID